MKSVLAKQQDNTIQLNITIPKEKVKQAWEQVIYEMVKTAELAGFRKGKAPKKMVEEKLDKGQVIEETLKKLLPEAYVESVKEHNLKPIVNPKIHVNKLDEDKDWEFTAITCELPEVNLNNYKDAVQKITAKSKIVVPGKEPEQPKFDDIVKALLDVSTATIPGILKESEIDRLLSQLLDDIKRLGMSLDQYLQSTGRTPETLRKEYEQKVENDLKLEFVLQKIAEMEKITVEDKEIEEAIQKAKDDTERKNLEANRYLLASILRQQKTLDFIKNL